MMIADVGTLYTLILLKELKENVEGPDCLQVSSGTS
jgi:hypothetical protein